MAPKPMSSSSIHTTLGAPLGACLRSGHHCWVSVSVLPSLAWEGCTGSCWAQVWVMVPLTNNKEEPSKSDFHWVREGIGLNWFLMGKGFWREISVCKTV